MPAPDWLVASPTTTAAALAADMGITKEGLRKDWQRPLEIILNHPVPRDATGQFVFSPVVARVLTRAIREFAPQVDDRDLRNSRALRAALAADPDVGHEFGGDMMTASLSAVPGGAWSELVAEVQALRRDQTDYRKTALSLTRALETQAAERQTHVRLTQDTQAMLEVLLPALSDRKTFDAEAALHLMVMSRAANTMASGAVEIAQGQIGVHRHVDELKARFDGYIPVFEMAEELRQGLQGAAEVYADSAAAYQELYSEICLMREDIAPMKVPDGLPFWAQLWWGVQRDALRHGGMVLLCGLLLLSAAWWFAVPSRLMYAHALTTSPRPWALLPAACHVQWAKPLTSRLPMCRY